MTYGPVWPAVSVSVFSFRVFTDVTQMKTIHSLSSWITVVVFIIIPVTVSDLHLCWFSLSCYSPLTLSSLWQILFKPFMITMVYDDDKSKCWKHKLFQSGRADGSATGHMSDQKYGWSLRWLVIWGKESVDISALSKLSSPVAFSFILLLAYIILLTKTQEKQQIHKTEIPKG